MEKKIDVRMIHRSPFVEVWPEVPHSFHSLRGSRFLRPRKLVEKEHFLLPHAVDLTVLG